MFLVLVGLSGCLGDGADLGDPGTVGDDDPRTSEGGAGSNETDPPHTDVVVLDADFAIQGQTSQSFDVRLPDNVTAVDFVLSWPGPVSQRASISAELGGCGTFSDSTIAGDFGGAGSLKGRLCKDADSGAQTFTVAAEGVVPDASIRLVAQIPKANETASQT